jgi:hypothetical protein
MANELAAVRAGLATRLDTITGLRVYTYPTVPNESPAAIIYLDRQPRKVTFGGDYEALFKVRIYLRKGTDAAAWAEVDKYLESSGTYSVAAAIYGDTTLGGNAHYCMVDADPDDTPPEMGTLDANNPNAMWAAQWTVKVVYPVS